MAVEICLLKSALSDLYAQASSSRQITRADQYGLLAALLNDAISEEERPAIDRLLRSVSKQQVKIVNELSTLQSL